MCNTDTFYTNILFHLKTYTSLFDSNSNRILRNTLGISNKYKNGELKNKTIYQQE
jgi:hypothetical protein